MDNKLIIMSFHFLIYWLFGFAPFIKWFLDSIFYFYLLFLDNFLLIAYSIV